VSRYILAIDQGTSSTKAIIFSLAGHEVASASAPLHTKYTPDGKAEQNPEAIYRSVIDSVAACVRKLETYALIRCGEIACAGIANQRETFVLWDDNGPLYDAVVWQCKRSVDICNELKEAGAETEIRDRSGLILDPYFSGTKVTSLLRNVPSVRASHDAGDAHFGTVDTWLVHRLTGGRVYATDQTNASRTLLFNIHTLDWDEELAGILGAPSLRLPEVYPSAHQFSESTFEGIFDTPVPITAMIGDSHAALFGERCYQPGEAKATLGTGSSILINAGDTAPSVSPSAMTTIGFGLPGRTDYALEGIVVSAGSVLNWLQRDLALFDDPSRLDEIAHRGYRRGMRGSGTRRARCAVLEDGREGIHRRPDLRDVQGAHSQGCAGVHPLPDSVDRGCDSRGDRNPLPVHQGRRRDQQKRVCDAVDGRHARVACPHVHLPGRHGAGGGTVSRNRCRNL